MRTARTSSSHTVFNPLTAVVATAAVLALIGCADFGDTTESSLATPTSAPTAPAHVLDAVFATHGGLETWRQFGSIRYRMDGFPLTPQVAKPSLSQVDLRTRRNRISADAYTVAFDGEEAWVTPNPEAVGLPPRFYTLGSFYFIGMPFVFGDEGAITTPEGTTNVDGTVYLQYRVTYAAGVGHSDDDDYVLLVEPNSNRLAWIHHSVTELNGGEPKRVAWRFDDWQNVDGLKLPAAMTFYGSWEHGGPQGDGASFTITDMRLSRRGLADTLFTRP